MKKDNKNDKLKETRFLTQESRIKEYYKEVFNIEIKEVLFKKKEKEKKINENIKGREEEQPLYINNSSLDGYQTLCLDIIILIKDNNKRIFKTKFLKETYNATIYKNEINNQLSFSEHIYCFVDKTLSEYCQKHYLDKLNTENLATIREKDNKINEDYFEWIIKNYK